MKHNNLENNLKKSILSTTGYQIIAIPISTDKFFENKSKSGIIGLDHYQFKTNGKSYSIVTDSGKLHLLEVIKVGNKVEDNIIEGSIILIIPSVPEDIVNPIMSKIYDKDIVVVSHTLVLACFTKKENITKDIIRKLNKSNCLQLVIKGLKENKIDIEKANTILEYLDKDNTIVSIQNNTTISNELLEKLNLNPNQFNKSNNETKEIMLLKALNIDIEEYKNLHEKGRTELIQKLLLNNKTNKTKQLIPSIDAKKT